MIKIFLKYLIYEICISVFFDAIKRNFSKVKFEFIGQFGGRFFPKLYTGNFIGVHPMSEPTGIHFALRYSYGKNGEMIESND